MLLLRQQRLVLDNKKASLSILMCFFIYISTYAEEIYTFSIYLKIGN